LYFQETRANAVLKSLEKTHSDLSDAAERSKILCVDDEPSIINVMQRGLSDDFDIYIATSGSYGLEVLKANPDIVVIISDQKMPGMTGTEFLAESQKIVPDAMRIMLTAYSDVNLLMNSINEGQIYKFLLKPFDLEILRVTIKRAVEHFHHKKAFEKAYRELLATQEQLVRSEKMSMLGKLMSGVAHELGNPISYINHASALARYQWTDLKKLFEKITQGRTDTEGLGQWIRENKLEQAIAEFDSVMQTIATATDLTMEIIQDLRGFSRLDDAEWTDVNLRNSVERAIHLVQTKYKHQIQFHCEFAEDLTVRGLSGPLMQVFINLIHNSAQSFESDGQIWIKTWSSDGLAKIAIKDNGRGIAKEHMGKLFEIGFTTKPEEEGTGLGLAICQGIIEKHRGTIKVSSEPGKGSEFVVSLPVGQS
jgi:signal transduction histidine kinase